MFIKCFLCCYNGRPFKSPYHFISTTLKEKTLLFISYFIFFYIFFTSRDRRFSYVWCVLLFCNISFEFPVSNGYGSFSTPFLSTHAFSESFFSVVSVWHLAALLVIPFLFLRIIQSYYWLIQIHWPHKSW